MTDLKTVLVNALNDCTIQTDNISTRCWGLEGTEIWSNTGRCSEEVILDADRLATAVRDHFLDREKVAALLAEVLDDYSHRSEAGFNAAVDRLIAALSGGSN